MADRQAAVTTGSGRQWPVFVVTALGAFVASLDLSIVNVAFPAMHRTFRHVTQADLAWVVTGYSIVFGALLVTGGRTADRIGRRRTFFTGLGIFALGSALCGLAPTVPLLIGGRLFQGVGAALALPSSLGLLLGAYPAARRSQMVALWGGVGALAVATGPSLGAAIITAGGWRWAFYVNLPVCAVAFLWGRAILPETRRSPETQSDFIGVALLTVSLASLVLAVSEGSDWGWTDRRILGGFVLTAVLVPALIARSRRHPHPVLDLSLFASRSFSVANAATVVYAAGFFAMLLGNILFLTGVWHYTIMRAGLAVTPGPVVVALVAGPAGRVAGRVGFRAVIAVGAIFFAGGLTWFAAMVGSQPAFVDRWLPGTILVGIGIGLTFPVLSAAAVSSLPPERFAVGSAVNQTARQIGGALGVAVLVVLLGNATGSTGSTGALHNFRHLWEFAASTAAATGLIALLIGPRRPPSTVVPAEALPAQPVIVAVSEPRPPGAPPANLGTLV